MVMRDQAIVDINLVNEAWFQWAYSVRRFLSGKKALRITNEQKDEARWVNQAPRLGEKMEGGEKYPKARTFVRGETRMIPAAFAVVAT